MELFKAPRCLRSEVVPATVAGVYALFLANKSVIPDFSPGSEDLLYIGKASGGDGFVGRCHFTGKTLNHSPRKSLSVLLMDDLELEVRGHGVRKWGLTLESDQRLSDWMMRNLCVAFFPLEAPETAEKKLIRHHAPPLNLRLCAQNMQHRRISALRSEAEKKANADANLGWAAIGSTRLYTVPVNSRSRAASQSSVDVRIDTAPEIARRYHIDAKRYRGALRKCKFRWHNLDSSWDVIRHGDEWREMIEVAQELSGLNLGELG